MDGLPKTVDVLYTQTLKSPPSCMTFVPGQEEFLVIGTYVLEATPDSPLDGAPQRRTGSLLCYQVDTTHMTLVHELHLDFAVLDIKFSQTPDLAGNPVLAVAGSKGNLQFYQINQRDRTLIFRHSWQLLPSEILTLYIEWHPSVPYKLMFTSSDGRISILAFAEKESGERICDVRALEQASLACMKVHGLEAWVATWSQIDNRAIYSGGDDALIGEMLEHDMVAAQSQQMQEDATEDELPNHTPSALLVILDKRIHTAGVTAILPLGTDEQGDNLILTGSYDEHLRLLKRPKDRRTWRLVEEINLGGGVWRLKLLSSVCDAQGCIVQDPLILASCMHAGPRIVRLECRSDGSWTFHVLGQAKGHDSMNYASDAREEASDSRLIVSSSFYDKKLCVWRWDRRQTTTS